MKTQIIAPLTADQYKDMFSELVKYSDLIYSLPAEALEHFLLESPDVIICFSEPIKMEKDIYKDLFDIFNDLKTSILPNQTLIRLSFMELEDHSENYLRLPFTPMELTDYLRKLNLVSTIK